MDRTESEALVRRYVATLPQAEQAAMNKWLASSTGASFLDDLFGPAIRNEMRDGVLYLDIHGIVGGLFGFTIGDFGKQLEGHANTPLVLRIDSPGGNYSVGAAIRQRLLDHNADTEARIEGLCGSAATVIAAGAKKRKIGLGGQWFIHEATMMAAFQEGQGVELDKSLKATNDEMAALYASIAKGDHRRYRAMMAKETWFSAQEAAEEGFAEYADSVSVKGGEGAKGDATAISSRHALDITPKSVSNAPDSDSNSTGAVAMTQEEQARLDAAEKAAADAKAELAALQAKATTSEAAEAIKAAQTATAEANAAREAAENRAKEAEAKVAAAELDAKVAEYPEGIRAMARLAISQNDADALKAVDAMRDQAAASQTVNGDANASEGGESASKRYDGLVKANVDAGMSRKEAITAVDATSEGRQLLAQIRSDAWANPDDNDDVVTR